MNLIYEIKRFKLFTTDMQVLLPLQSMPILRRLSINSSQTQSHHMYERDLSEFSYRRWDFCLSKKEEIQASLYDANAQQKFRQEKNNMKCHRQQHTMQHSRVEL